MSKADGYVCVRYKCKGNLITVYTTSGIKLAGSQYRVLNGTREVAIVPLTAKRGIEPVEVGSRRIWIVRDSGGGLSRSSDTASGRLGSLQGKHNIVRVDIPVILRPFYLITHNLSLLY